MNISMVGIDYRTASIEVREQFSFTKTQGMEFCEQAASRHEMAGCILISTCNRTELWCSDAWESPFSILMQERGADGEKYAEHFTSRQGDEAVNYLFELACGMHSQIFGEDQILTQIREALGRSRECGCADSVLETLFRSAVTAAKQVKTEVRLTARDMSIPEGAAALLEARYGPLEGRRCMVIGNGEMGRLMTRILIARGCQVAMTLRQYKKHDVVIPKECEVILYEERYQHLRDKDLIFSATVSPHYTIEAEKVCRAMDPDRSYLFVDLAVPRDIEPAVGRLSGAVLYDTDMLGMVNGHDERLVARARVILKEHMDEFRTWYYFREWIPAVQRIGKTAGRITNAKLTKVYREIDQALEEPEELKRNVRKAAEKSVTKILYGLKNHLSPEQWKDCITALEEAAGDCEDS